jgi:hypothetical protein
MSSLPLCWIAGPLLIGAVLLRRSGDKRYVLADVPFVIRRPCPLAGRGLGLLSGGVVFPELSKLLSQENALGAPCHITACYTGHQAGTSADAFAVVGGGCTGRAHGCKAKQGRRGNDGADVWFLLPQ